MSERMAALVWRGADTAVEQVERPASRAGRAVIDVAFAGICGTDLHICHGEHPRARPPLTLGHEFVGRLAAPAAGLDRGMPVTVEPLLWCGGCTACRRGARHVCDRLRMIGIDEAGGIAEQVSVPTELLVPLPPDVGLRPYAFVEPLAVAVHAVRRGRVGLGDTVLVVGAGPIGLAVALCARLSGAGEVLILEPAPLRRQAAEELGFAVVEPAELAHRQVTGRVRCHVLFDTAAVAPVAATFTDWVDAAQRIVVVGVYGRPVPVDLQAVTFAELEIVGTRVYTRDDLHTAVHLIRDGRFDPAPLITSTVPLVRAADALALLRAGSEIKVLVETAP